MTLRRLVLATALQITNDKLANRLLGEGITHKNGTVEPPTAKTDFFNNFKKFLENSPVEDESTRYRNIDYKLLRFICSDFLLGEPMDIVPEYQVCIRKDLMYDRSIKQVDEESDRVTKRLVVCFNQRVHAKIMDKFLNWSTEQMITEFAKRDETKNAIMAELDTINRNRKAVNVYSTKNQAVFNQFYDYFETQCAMGYMFTGSVKKFTVNAFVKYFQASNLSDIMRNLREDDILKQEAKSGRSITKELKVTTNDDPPIHNILVSIYNADQMLFFHSGNIDSGANGVMYSTYYMMLSILCKRRIEEFNKAMHEEGFEKYSMVFVDEYSREQRGADWKIYDFKAEQLVSPAENPLLVANRGINGKIVNAEEVINYLFSQILDGTYDSHKFPLYQQKAMYLGLKNTEGANPVWKHDPNGERGYCQFPKPGRSDDSFDGIQAGALENYQTFDTILQAVISTYDLMIYLENRGVSLVDFLISKYKIFTNPVLIRSIDFMSSLDYLDDIEKLHAEASLVANKRRQETSMYSAEEMTNLLKDFEEMKYSYAGSEQNNKIKSRVNQKQAMLNGLIGSKFLNQIGSFRTTFEKLRGMADCISLIPRSWIELRDSNQYKGISIDLGPYKPLMESDYGNMSITSAPGTYSEFYLNLFILSNPERAYNFTDIESVTDQYCEETNSFFSYMRWNVMESPTACIKYFEADNNANNVLASIQEVVQNGEQPSEFQKRVGIWLNSCNGTVPFIPKITLNPVTKKYSVAEHCTDFCLFNPLSIATNNPTDDMKYIVFPSDGNLGDGIVLNRMSSQNLYRTNVLVQPTLDASGVPTNIISISDDGNINIAYMQSSTKQERMVLPDGMYTRFGKVSSRAKELSDQQKHKARMIASSHAVQFRTDIRLNVVDVEQFFSELQAVNRTSRDSGHMSLTSSSKMISDDMQFEACVYFVWTIQLSKLQQSFIDIFELMRNLCLDILTNPDADNEDYSHAESLLTGLKSSNFRNDDLEWFFEILQRAKDKLGNIPMLRDDAILGATARCQEFKYRNADLRVYDWCFSDDVSDTDCIIDAIDEDTTCGNTRDFTISMRKRASLRGDMLECVGYKFRNPVDRFVMLFNWTSAKINFLRVLRDAMHMLTSYTYEGSPALSYELDYCFDIVKTLKTAITDTVFSAGRTIMIPDMIYSNNIDYNVINMETSRSIKNSTKYFKKSYETIDEYMSLAKIGLVPRTGYKEESAVINSKFEEYGQRFSCCPNNIPTNLRIELKTSIARKASIDSAGFYTIGDRYVIAKGIDNNNEYYFHCTGRVLCVDVNTREVYEEKFEFPKDNDRYQSMLHMAE